VQSLNRFQAEIDGPLKGGDPGVRLLEARPDAARPYDASIPAAFSPRPDEWRAVLLPRVFNDDEQAGRAPPIRERAAPPALVLNAEDAASLGVAAGQALACEIGDAREDLAVEIDPALPRGVAGLAGLAQKAHAVPAWLRLRPAEPPVS
jgi:NADH-quinone oxidoreductase subunit G